MSLGFKNMLTSTSIVTLVGRQHGNGGGLVQRIMQGGFVWTDIVWRVCTVLSRSTKSGKIERTQYDVADFTGISI
jgi:hypothetical protein